MNNNMSIVDRIMEEIAQASARTASGTTTRLYLGRREYEELKRWVSQYRTDIPMMKDGKVETFMLCQVFRVVEDEHLFVG